MLDLATARPRPRWIWALALVVLVATATQIQAQPGGPLVGLDLPDEWERKFWADPDVKALLAMKPDAVAKLVPTQAGLRYCRCPSCDAPEADEPLAWSARKPEVVTCRRCNASFPDDKIPAKVDGKIPAEEVEVRPGVTHSYPYHKVADGKQRYEDERLYLDARRDHEAREFLARVALYAATRYHEQPAGQNEAILARLAATLILRFAQVYPDYALHLDQPNQPKFFEPARRGPPYRRGYRTAKWDWSGSLDVPLNLVIAYALIRDTPALAEAGRIQNEANPARTIERDLFRASAGFCLSQPVRGRRTVAPGRSRSSGRRPIARRYEPGRRGHEATQRLCRGRFLSRRAVASRRCPVAPRGDGDARRLDRAVARRLDPGRPGGGSPRGRGGADAGPGPVGGVGRDDRDRPA